MEPDINDLIKVFTDITNVRTMKKFFDEIFTEAERKDLALRWQLMKMVNDEIPQRDIAANLGISLCKITRGAKIVKDTHSVTSAIINRKA